MSEGGMCVRVQLMKQLEERIHQYVLRNKVNDEKIIKKHDVFARRKAEIVKVTANGRIMNIREIDDQNVVNYRVHQKYLIKQGEHLYIEEEVENRSATFYNDVIIEDKELPVIFQTGIEVDQEIVLDDIDESRLAYTYNRLKAVQYAERWWSEYNPAYKSFDVDCTNYISQCLHAGGAPMRGQSNRNRGWWYTYHNWSFSWTVANALTLYLTNSSSGLRAKQVTDPRELQLGDVICYDFQGDGRFDHTTIVTGKDANNEPLVNAHTYDSRMRYWAYEDSTAYTPNIKYKMFTIIDDS